MVINDDTRICAATNNQGREKVPSHFSRTRRSTKKQVESMSLRPVAERLAKSIGQKVDFCDECIVIQLTIKQLEWKYTLLENVRYHAEEEANDPEFSEQLATHIDIYVNDAFGAAHRAHALLMVLRK